MNTATEQSDRRRLVRRVGAAALLVMIGVALIGVAGVLAARSTAWQGGITAAIAMLAVEVSVVLSIWSRRR